MGILALFRLFLVDSLSRSQILFTSTISIQIWTNYQTHIFTGEVRTPRPISDSASIHQLIITI